MNWYYETGGQQQGPISEADLDRLIAEGKITSKTLVWREGQGDWQPLEQARPTQLGQAQGIRCASCGQFFAPNEVIQIGQRWICAGCKPAVLQGLQQGGELPTFGEEARIGPAWERRRELGIVMAAWETLKDVLMKPAETFAAMKRTGGLGAPLLYCVIMGTIGGTAGIAYQLGTRGLMPQPQYPPNMEGMMRFVTSPMYALLILLFLPVGMVITSFIGAGITHLSLMICGGARQPFETTFRVYCYSYGSAMSLQIVPICGGMVAALWALVSTCIGLAKAHETDTWRAVLAICLPMLLCCGAFTAIIVSALAFLPGHH